MSANILHSSAVGELDNTLRDKLVHLISASELSSLADSAVRLEIPLEYRGEKWDGACVQPAGCVRYYRSDGEEHYAVESCWRNPREAGSIPVQRDKLVREWVKIGRRAKALAGCQPRFSAARITDCDTEGELVQVIARAGHPAGTAFSLDNLCFISTGPTREHHWIAISDSSRHPGTMPICGAISQGGLDFMVKLVAEMRCRQPSSERTM